MNFAGKIMPENIFFAEPAFLKLLWPLAALFVLWLAVVIIRRINRPALTYASKAPLIGRIKLWGLFIIPAGALMVLALAKPSVSNGSLSLSQGDIEVIIVVDRSISMRANDVRPSRLDIARREALYVESLLKEGDKSALFVFGRESHRKIYLSKRLDNTFERIGFIFFPPTLDGDGLIWDSNFAVMLEDIYQSLDRQDAKMENYSGKNYKPQKRSNRIVLLFSDGEDQFRKEKPANAEEEISKEKYVKRLNSALVEFKRRGLKIYPVGIGTRTGAQWLSLLEGYDNPSDYNVGLIEEWKGRVTRIDKENLLFLSRSTGVNPVNDIWAIENGTTTVHEYLAEAINSNRRIAAEFSAVTEESNQGLWQYLLVIALAILALGMLLHPVSGYFNKKRS